jgi:hypothetical protein
MEEALIEEPVTLEGPCLSESEEESDRKVRISNREKEVRVQLFV